MNIKKSKLMGLLLLLSAVGNVFGQITSKDASALEWKLAGFKSDLWRWNSADQYADIVGIPAKVPGSVQQALKDAGRIPDWNIGLNYFSSEWITNRHWLYSTDIPDGWLDKNAGQIFLHCAGLDHKGVIMVNGKEAGSFDNAFIPYSFRIDPYLNETGNKLTIVFYCPPENLGQIYWTSKVKEWKPRFYYGWDWMPRIVQVGVWDKVQFVTIPEHRSIINSTEIFAGAAQKEDKGNLKVKLQFTQSVLTQKVKIALMDGNKTLVSDEVNAKDLIIGKTYENLKVKRWYPNGAGEQPLYRLQITLSDNGKTVQQIERRVGFRSIEWQLCEGAPAHAEPWICSVNNQPLFLQGINWTPIRPNFADLTEADYALRLKQYKDLGINLIRVWGGGFPEKDWLYDLCDELGILVLMDFPLSSSGLDNYPPESPDVINTMMQIVDHYVARLHHHASLLLWCGGNELDDGKTPVTANHPLIGAMKRRVQLLDPTRKFIDASPSGPRSWDAHGPWSLPFKDEKQDMNDVREYWSNNISMFHSEVGAPGAMSADMMRKYSGGHKLLPASFANPLWRTVNWWVDWDSYLSTHGGQEPTTLEEYVNWSRQRQSEGLCILMEMCKNSFPRCGGVILWMGHDSFPCMINTSIMDFEGNLKPAALELSKIWKRKSS